MWRIAEEALADVGDATLGEFREKFPRSLHLRRRLTPAEWGDKPWGMDYRGTPDGWERLAYVCTLIPSTLHEAIMSELRT